MHNIKKLEPTGELCIKFTDDELAELGWGHNEKLSIEHDNDGRFIISKHVKMELDISDWSREVLEYLIYRSCEEDLGINDVITNILTNSPEIQETRKYLDRVKHV